MQTVENRYAKNNSMVRKRTTNTAARSHTLTSTHQMRMWLSQKTQIDAKSHAIHTKKLNHQPAFLLI